MTFSDSSVRLKKENRRGLHGISERKRCHKRIFPKFHLTYQPGE
jgi:hypothetical protein